MTIDLTQMNPIIIALITILFSSPLIALIANSWIFKKKNNADVDHIIMENMKILVDSYKDNKLQDEKIKDELRKELGIRKAEIKDIRAQQHVYIENSTNALKLLANTQSELEQMKANHKECMDEHEKAKKRLDELNPK